MDDRGTFKRKVRRLVGLARSADWLKVVVWTDFLKLYECYVRMEDAREKYWGLYRVSQDCHTLILGSSHAYHGFYAEGDEYNLGDHSLNFYYAGKILKYWLDFGLPKLKNVVLFCDIFSGGDILEQSSEAFRAAQLHNLYGIEYQYGMPMVETLGVEFRRIDELYAAMRNKPVRVENDYRGNLDFDHVTYDFPKDLAEERVGGHLKIGKGRTQVKWLDLIARGGGQRARTWY